MGYIGSIILLLICLGLLWIRSSLNKILFYTGGFMVDWIAQILTGNTLTILSKKPEADYIWKGYRELKIVYNEFMQTTVSKVFICIFLFNSGVQTVMLLATIFASKAIEWPEDEGTTGLLLPYF